MSKTFFITIIAVFVIAGFAAWQQQWGPFAQKEETPNQQIDSFDECVAEGNPVMESYPRRCRTIDGRMFTERIQEKITPPPPPPADDTGGQKKDDSVVCIQVITRARNIITAEEKDFLTPCDVPAGWQAISPQSGEGMISGKVSVGPICPVERPDEPCLVPPEAYTSRQIVIYKADGKTEVARFAINPDGTYNVSLETGSYVLDILHQGIDNSKDLPHPFIISSGSSQKFDFSIDTGIR